MAERGIKVVQFIQPHHDMVDAAFRASFPKVRFVNVDGVPALAREISDADVLTVTNPWYDREVAEIVAASRAAPQMGPVRHRRHRRRARGRLSRGVAITNVRGVRTGILSSHAICLMLGVMRGLAPYRKYRRARQWARDEMFPWLVPTDEGTMVLCGMGDVGHAIAHKAKAFDMTVIGVSRAGAVGGDFDRVVPRDSLRDVLPEADVVMLATAYDAGTHHMIGAPELAAMKKTAAVVNVARGALIDEAALIAALREGRILGAGLDVFETEPLPADSPLWDMDNVLMDPHVAGQARGAERERMRELFEDNMRRFLDGRPLRNLVDSAGNPLTL